jgi:hypothetical protein
MVALFFSLFFYFFFLHAFVKRRIHFPSHADVQIHRLSPSGRATVVILDSVALFSHVPERE